VEDLHGGRGGFFCVETRERKPAGHPNQNCLPHPSPTSPPFPLLGQGLNPPLELIEKQNTTKGVL